MRVLIQRVLSASVEINGEIKSKIAGGMLVLLGIEHSDAVSDVEYLAQKLVNLRIFDDENGVMNRSVLDIGGEVLVVSQFTLHARTRKGNRPSYMDAAPPEIAVPLYEHFCKLTEEMLGTTVKTGEFGAEMQVALVNDGPVTIRMDSKDK